MSTNTTWGICPRCKNGTPVEHTRLYGCKFDDLHDFEAATRTAPLYDLDDVIAEFGIDEDDR